jgi:hypothetical protein
MQGSVKTADSVLPGVQTFVTDKSMLNLPNDIDREKQVVLPSGSSATPQSGDDRSIGTFEYGKPDNDITDRPRTLGVPGEDYGHPTKYDYGFPTRRDMTAYSSGDPRPTKQRRQINRQRAKDRARYRKERRQRIRNSLRRYHHFCKRNQKCTRKRQFQRENPQRYRRKPPISEAMRKRLRRKREQAHRQTQTASIRMAFYIEPIDAHGIIKFVHADHVVFRMGKLLGILPVSVFSRVARFHNESAMTRFMDMVVVDPDVDPATLHGIAALHGVDTEDMDIENWSSRQLHKAARLLGAGDTFMYDRGSPTKDINRPGPNVGYDMSGPSTAYLTVDDKSGSPPAYAAPDRQVDNVPAGSSRVVPNGEGQLWSGDPTYVKSAAIRIAVLISDVEASVDPGLRAKSKDIRPSLKRVDPTIGLYTFSTPSSSGPPYTVRVQAQRKGNTTDLTKLDVRLSCSCDFFRWQGPEHWARSGGYLFGKPRGTASRPDIKDPKHKHPACKHVLAVFDMIKAYKYRLDGIV